MDKKKYGGLQYQSLSKLVRVKFKYLNHVDYDLKSVMDMMCCCRRKWNRLLDCNSKD